jgi:hypothetical protein
LRGLIPNIVESIGSGTDSDLYGFVLPKIKAIDIDEESDFLFAEAVYKATRLL